MLVESVLPPISGEEGDIGEGKDLIVCVTEKGKVYLGGR